MRVKSISKIEKPPVWFSPDPVEVEVLHAPMANLCFIFGKADGLLYASDFGVGLRPGAPEAPLPPKKADASPVGRLPTTPPPLPVPD